MKSKKVLAKNFGMVGNVQILRKGKGEKMLQCITLGWTENQWQQSNESKRQIFGSNHCQICLLRPV